MRVAPVVLALLLVCSAVAGAGVAPTLQDDGADAETTPPTDSRTVGVTAVTANATNVSGQHRILSLPESNVSNARIDEARLDAGVAVDVDAGVAAERMETIALRQRVEAAETNDERQRRILDGMNELEKRAVTLRSNQRTAISAYAAGNIDARTLYVRLARVQAEADALEHRLEVLTALAEDTEGTTIDGGRTAALKLQLREFDGPVRQRASGAIRGNEPPTRVYAAASRNSIVLTTVIDGEYVREVYRGDLRSLSSSTIPYNLQENITSRSYPEIWAESGSLDSTDSGGTAVIDVPFAAGHLTAFIDGGSERVFKEHQRIHLANVSTGEVRERTIDLTLRVNRTYAGGPLRIEVLDPDTDEPVDAAIRIATNGQGSTRIGATGDDGVLWTVAPRGNFVVTAIDEDSDDLSTIELSSGTPLTVEDAYQPNASDGVS
ncbi:hypothetical protein HUG10_17975 [Halorarum halophilum]|uniref:Uncharacterized protein n=1 Tax=Halorarum halophilum TaxID=2743090 RepID=A0A7D5KPA9_9EURY|nr:hypothetical protein [Halobaculum halophilum]QLG29302.1 hypothetical protein HUG10_17975 [Halobaculum halophilum]